MRIVENTPARLVMRDRTLWVAWFCLGCAALIGLQFAVVRGDPRVLITGALFTAFSVFFVRATDVVVDKAQRTCALRRRDIWRVTRTDLGFGDITDVRVEPMPVGDGGGGIHCRLSFVTPAGIVPTSAAYGPHLATYEAMRETVADAIFAGRARPPAADPIETLIRAHRGVDAAMVLHQREGLGLVEAHARVQEMRQRLGL